MNRGKIVMLVLAGSAAVLLVQCSQPTEPTDTKKKPSVSHLDAFVVNYGQYNQVYLNDGHGSFTVNDVTASSDGSSSADYSRAVALGDLDGDGDLDAFVGNYNRNRVYINDGTGTFSGYDVSTEQDIGRGVALGDLDGDGDLDAFVVNEGMDRKGGINKVYLNEGDVDGDGLLSFTIYDVTDDKEKSQAVVLMGGVDPDALVINWYEPVRIYEMSFAGTGTFTGHAVDIGPWGLVMGTSVAMADMNLDGFRDAVIGHYESTYEGVTGAMLLYGDGGGGLDFAFGLDDHGETRGVALGDLDGDLDPDIFVIHNGDPPSVYLNTVYLYNGSPVCSLTTVDVVEDYHACEGVVLGDLDGDGDLDAFVVSFGNVNRIYLNLGTGHTWEGRDVSPPGSLSSCTAVALGDLDGK